MALLDCDFFSDALEVGTSMTVVLPQATESQIGVSARDDGSDPPVLYLLHGLSDDHTAWLRYTSIERYAAAAGLAVVMPAAGRSFYADEAHGHRYWTYVSEELPGIVRSFFRVSDRPEHTFVAGLSMGGYGALKLALTHPGRFGAAASLSGALDVQEIVRRPERADLAHRVFDIGGDIDVDIDRDNGGDNGRDNGRDNGGGGPDAVGADADLFALLDRPGGELPPLFVACGTDEDVLMDANTRFVARARAAGAAVTTDFRPGTHEWGLWDAVIRVVVDWLPLPR